MKHVFTLVSLLLLSLSAFSASIGTDTITGTWHGITYTLTLPDSVLTFTGSGKIYQPGRPIVYPWDSIKSQVKHLRIEGTITNVPDQMLDSAANLETIWMSDNVKTIDSRTEVYFEGAFADCHKLKSVRLSSNLTLINWGTFFQCRSLQEIEIPATVKNIGNNAFYGCSGMREITCLNPVPPTVKDGAFTKTSIPLYVPSGSIKAYQAASVWKLFTLFPLVVGVEPTAPDTTELSWLPVDNASRYELRIYSDSIALDTTLVIYADSTNGGIRLVEGTSTPKRVLHVALDDIGSVVIITIKPNSGMTIHDPFIVTVSTISAECIPVQFNMTVFCGDVLLKEDEGDFILNYDFYHLADAIEIVSADSYYPSHCFDLHGHQYPISQWLSLPSGIYILHDGGETRRIFKQ